MKRLSVLTTVVVMVLMVHAWGESAIGVFPLASCNVDCSGVSTGDKVPDPYNCTAFYYCNNGEAYGPVHCDPGNVFDPSTGECVVGSSCEPICGAGSGCPLTCNDNMATIGDAFDCNVYYICTPGEAVPASCPLDRPYFDGSTHLCVNDESVCCSGYCQPYCDDTAAVVPDPTDCTKFYFCDGEGVPENNFQCSGGGYFDVQLGNCVEGPVPDPCPTLCDAARKF